MTLSQPLSPAAQAHYLFRPESPGSPPGVCTLSPAAQANILLLIGFPQARLRLARG